MREADVAARGLLTQFIRHEGIILAVLLGGRDFAEVIVAADADGVLAIATGIFDRAAAGDGDKLTGGRFTMQVFDGGQAGGDRAGADALAVFIDGQGLRRLVDHDAVHIAGLDGAQLVGADITADERAVFIAVGFYDGPAVIQILDQVQALAQAGHRTDLLAVVGGVIDVGGFGFADVDADHRAGERRPDVRVARVGRQPPVARIRLIDGIAHAHADFIALLAERGLVRGDIFHHLLRFARGRRFGGRGRGAGGRRGRGGIL